MFYAALECPLGWGLNCLAVVVTTPGCYWIWLRGVIKCVLRFEQIQTIFPIRCRGKFDFKIGAHIKVRASGRTPQWTNISCR